MSKVNQALLNYSNFASNQALSTNIYESEKARQEADEEKQSEEAENQNLDMLTLHFFGDKIKDWLVEKLSKATGIDKETIEDVAKNPVQAVQNAVNEGTTEIQSTLNNARTSIEDQAAERGLNPEGVLNRTPLPTPQEIDRIREGVVSGDDPEEVDTEQALPEEPEAPEPEAAAPEAAAPETEPEAEAAAPETEPEAEAPVPEAVSNIPTGGVAMPGREEMTQILQQRAEDPAQTLIDDIQAHMRQYGEDDLADRISNNTTIPGEVESKLQEQADNIFTEPQSLSADANNLIIRSSRLQQETEQASEPEPEPQPPAPAPEPPAPAPEPPAPEPVEDTNINIGQPQDLEDDLFF